MRKCICAAGVVLIAATSVLIPTPVGAQDFGTGSRNLQEVGHLPRQVVAMDDATASLVDVRLDQRADRPFAYVALESGWAMLDLTDPSSPSVLVFSPDRFDPQRAGRISSIDYLQADGKDLVAVGRENRLSIYDASLSSGGSRHEEMDELVDLEGSFASLFAYKHSSGRPLLIAGSGGDAKIYDAVQLLEGTTVPLVEIPTPDLPDSTVGYESVFAAYDAGTDADRFYGAGAGGYHVYDIADLDSVFLVTSAAPAAVRRGLGASPSPDGRYLVTTAPYRSAPVRIFDLQPVFDGTFRIVKTSVGAWANNWRGFHLDHETRWPYVFVAAADQGLQIFNARDVTEPYTVAHFDTSPRQEGTVNDRPHEAGGAVSVDVRNHDGLILVGDRETGVWLFKLEGFQGWDGRGWGFPNISSAQDWLNGPDGSSTFD